MKILVFLMSLLTVGDIVVAQSPILKVGDQFPSVVFEKTLNAPTTKIDLNERKDKQLWIINFWGTWCSPCLPEMRRLAKLQEEKNGKIQIIGLSNDPVIKLQKYLTNNPSQLWLVSDTSSLLYQMLQLAYVDQAMILDQNNKIVAIMQTSSINSQFIDSLLQGKSVKSNYATLEKSTTDDPFGVDSSTRHSLVFKGYMKGFPAMTKTYLDNLKGRRISLFNQTLPSLFRTAYDIKSYQQLQLDSNVLDYKKIEDYNDKSQVYSIDLVIDNASTDNLFAKLRYVLQTYTPIKARWETRKMSVGILTSKTKGEINAPKSFAKEATYSYSGKGFEGKCITIKEFAEDYVSNEYQILYNLPVVDETDIVGNFDITTHLDARDKGNLLKSLAELGLEIKLGERELPVLVLYK